MPDFISIDSLSRKSTISGSEKLPVSSTEYIDVSGIGEYMIVQTTGDGEDVAISQKAVTEKIWKDTIEIRTGNNVIDRGYVPADGEDGGAGYYIFPDGTLASNASWFTTEFIKWDENSDYAIFSRLRSCAQYDENKLLISDSIYYPDTEQFDEQIHKHTGAKYFRISFIAELSANVRGNFGVELLPFEPHIKLASKVKYNINDVYANENLITRIKRMLMSEEFELINATYTDGLIDEPVQIKWADGFNGQLTFDRNTFGSVIKIYATHGDIDFEMTLTRDANDNVTNNIITF